MLISIYNKNNSDDIRKFVYGQVNQAVVKFIYAEDIISWINSQHKH